MIKRPWHSCGERESNEERKGGQDSRLTGWALVTPGEPLNAGHGGLLLLSPKAEEEGQVRDPRLQAHYRNRLGPRLPWPCALHGWEAASGGWGWGWGWGRAGGGGGGAGGKPPSATGWEAPCVERVQRRLWAGTGRAGCAHTELRADRGEPGPHRGDSLPPAFQNAVLAASSLKRQETPARRRSARPGSPRAAALSFPAPLPCLFLCLLSSSPFYGFQNLLAAADLAPQSVSENSPPQTRRQTPAETRSVPSHSDKCIVGT